jgi:hypothetical protein
MQPTMNIAQFFTPYGLTAAAALHDRPIPLRQLFAELWLPACARDATAASNRVPRRDHRAEFEVPVRRGDRKPGEPQPGGIVRDGAQKNYRSLLRERFHLQSRLVSGRV